MTNAKPWELDQLTFDQLHQAVASIDKARAELDDMKRQQR